MHLRSPRHAAALAAALAGSLLAPAELHAQTSSSWVVPDLTDTDGIANASTGQPWWATTTDCRQQQMYDAGDFPYQTPITITRIRFRPRDYTPASVSWTGGTYQMDIRMSTSQRTPATMSDVYANNPGADETVVHSGAVPLLPGSGNDPGPSAPYVDLTLTTPFTYDPSQGSLLVDFVTDGTLYTGGTAYFPAVERFGQANAARVWSWGSITDPTGTYEMNSGLVMDFDFTFAGTHADFYADELGAAVGAPLQFYDRSITDAVGGVQSWAWDFDGDGLVDSSAQNPTYAYAAPGRFDVTLTVTTATGSASKTRSSYVVAGTPTATVPDLLQYQFNDVRGDTVGNTASSGYFPSEGTVSNTGWQGDPGAGREGFGPNESGYGMLASTGIVDTNYVDAGAGLTWNGSFSLSWWQRMDPTAPSNAWAYAFGGPGDTFTAYNRGGAYKSIVFIGTSSTGDLLCLKDLHHPDWVHLCLVVDDTAGAVTWYVDGKPAGTRSFPAGTHGITNSQFLVGKHDGNPSHARYYTHDDFRVYGRALTYGEVLGTMAGENASATPYGDDCWSFGTAPSITAIGRPTIGNASFASMFRGGAPNAGVPLACPVGFQAATGLPQPLPAGFGCGELQTSIDLIAFLTTDATGDATLALPVPNDPVFAGLHAYTQFVSVLGVTRALDLNLQLD